MILAITGGVFSILASTLLYLASPNQRWGSLPVSPRFAGWAGLALLGAAIVMLLQWAGPATAIFIVMTLAMTVWSVVPIMVALWRRQPEGPK